MRLLQDLALFTELAETRSFTRAAARLGMPASTLSRRIAQLEREVGVPLFVRTTRRVELTGAGQIYHARCAHLVEEAKMAHEQLMEAMHAPTGSLRISCAPDLAMVYLPALLPPFLQQYPAIQIELDLSTDIVDLVSGRFDAALRFGKLADSGLYARRIATLQHGLYASPAYLVGQTLPRHPADLALHQCLRMRSRDFGSMWRFAQQTGRGAGLSGETIEVDVQGSLIVSSVASIHQCIRAGAGIGWIDRALAAADVADGRLVPLLTDWDPITVDLHLVTASKWMPARLRAFSEYLAGHWPS